MRSTRWSRSPISADEPAVLAFEPPARQGAVDRQPERLGLERLRQVVVGAGADRLHGAGDRAVGRDHHEADIGMLGAHPGEELAAVAVRQTPVGDHEVDRRPPELAGRFGERGRTGDAVALGGEEPGEEVPLIGFVLDDQQAFVVHRPRSPMSRVAVVPVRVAPRGASRRSPA